LSPSLLGLRGLLVAYNNAYAFTLQLAHNKPFSTTHFTTPAVSTPAAQTDTKIYLKSTPNNMTVFAGKTAFLDLGLERVSLSAAHVSQDCSVCLKPLAVHHNHASPQSVLRGYHSAVRISACGHVHGEVCLKAWLDVGTSCPTCNRVLFERGSEPITQKEVNELMFALAPDYGEARVMTAIVSMAQKQDKEQATLRRYHEQEVAKEKVKEANARDEEFSMGVDDFLDSDEEMDFEDSGDEEYIVDDEEPEKSAN
jgi:hypothetical protein